MLRVGFSFPGTNMEKQQESCNNFGLPQRSLQGVSSCFEGGIGLSSFEMLDRRQTKQVDVCLRRTHIWGYYPNNGESNGK